MSLDPPCESDEEEDAKENPNRRRILRERPRESPSPAAPSKNAFDLLREGAKAKAKQPLPKKPSEFVADQAVESDDDDLLGFGKQEADDDEDTADADARAAVEGLVDDAVLDEETQAADLVVEKHM